MKKLSILIPTTPDRKKEFEKLRREMWRQIRALNMKAGIEIIDLEDNKEMTIGAKRKELYKMAAGLYSVQWDSDDWIHPFGLEMITAFLPKRMTDKNPDRLPDCVTYKELIIWNGTKPETSNFSLKYDDWRDNYDGFNYVRTPFFKTPIKTSICNATEIPDSRFGEDHDFARNIKPKLKTEHYINEFIYIYTPFTSDHKERYGIK